MAKSLHSRVVIKKPTIKFKKFKKEETNVGYAYRAEHKVEVDTGICDSEIFKTLFHEIIHLLLPNLKESQVVKIEKIYGEAMWLAVLRLKKKWRK
jgi:hypothetical protein